MTKPTEPALVDTNVLLYAWDEQSPYHGACRELLERGERGDSPLCVTNQILLEYFSIGTNPKRMRRPLTSSQAWAEVRNFTDAFRVLHPPADLVERVSRLATTLDVRGADVYDLSHAATAIASGVLAAYSYDGAVFRRVAGFEVKTP